MQLRYCTLVSVTQNTACWQQTHVDIDAQSMVTQHMGNTYIQPTEHTRQHIGYNYIYTCTVGNGAPSQEHTVQATQTFGKAAQSTDTAFSQWSTKHGNRVNRQKDRRVPLIGSSAHENGDTATANGVSSVLIWPKSAECGVTVHVQQSIECSSTAQ